MKMRYILLSAFLMLSTAVKAETATIPYLDGLPVMPSFTVMEDSLLVFDKPQGQLTEIALVCTRQCPSERAARDFYNKALTATGWQITGQNRYQRGEETMQIDYSVSGDTGASVIITFRSEA